MAQVRTLTKSEVEELVDQLRQRPFLWMGKEMLWVRRKEGTNRFALKMVNGLPNNMYSLYVKILNEENEEEIERYVEWLLRKLTSYGWRKDIEDFLRRTRNTPVEDLARIITSPEGVRNVVVVEQSAPPIKRSKCLENLLKGMKR